MSQPCYGCGHSIPSGMKLCDECFNFSVAKDNANARIENDKASSAVREQKPKRNREET